MAGFQPPYMAVWVIPEESAVSWGDSAPKGESCSRTDTQDEQRFRFLGQTLVNSLRDMGYNSTTRPETIPSAEDSGVPAVYLTRAMCVFRIFGV